MSMVAMAFTILGLTATILFLIVYLIDKIE